MRTERSFCRHPSANQWGGDPGLSEANNIAETSYIGSEVQSRQFLGEFDLVGRCAFQLPVKDEDFFGLSCAARENMCYVLSIRDDT